MNARRKVFNTSQAGFDASWTPHPTGRCTRTTRHARRTTARRAGRSAPRISSDGRTKIGTGREMGTSRTGTTAIVTVGGERRRTPSWMRGALDTNSQGRPQASLGRLGPFSTRGHRPPGPRRFAELAYWTVRAAHAGIKWVLFVTRSAPMVCLMVVDTHNPNAWDCTRTASRESPLLRG